MPCIEIWIYQRGKLGENSFFTQYFYGFGLLVFHLPKTTVTREGKKKDDSSAFVKEQ